MKINEKKVREALGDLEGECVFWACGGPDKPFESMVTCRVCAAVQLLREALGQKALSPTA